MAGEYYLLGWETPEVSQPLKAFTSKKHVRPDGEASSLGQGPRFPFLPSP